MSKKLVIGWTLAIIALAAGIVVAFAAKTAKVYPNYELVTENGGHYAYAWVIQEDSQNVALVVEGYDPITLCCQGCGTAGFTGQVLPNGVVPAPTDKPSPPKTTPTVAPPTVAPSATPVPEPTMTPGSRKTCNSGRGNGSEGEPDCDPGNSGGHNQGGD